MTLMRKGEAKREKTTDARAVIARMRMGEKGVKDQSAFSFNYL